MSVTTPGAVTGATKRQAGIWTGILVAMYAGTLVLLMRNASLGTVGLVQHVAPYLAFIVAIRQAYRNGSVVLSWLIPAAPFVALLTSDLVGFAQLSIGYIDVVGDLIVAVFLGTTAHLLGMEMAKSREKSPRISSQTEQRGLLVVLTVTGTLFAVFYVLPRL